jgi:hypothetical protein
MKLRSSRRIRGCCPNGNLCFFGDHVFGWRLDGECRWRYTRAPSSGVARNTAHSCPEKASRSSIRPAAMAEPLASRLAADDCTQRKWPGNGGDHLANHVLPGIGGKTGPKPLPYQHQVGQDEGGHDAQLGNNQAIRARPRNGTRSWMVIHITIGLKRGMRATRLATSSCGTCQPITCTAEIRPISMAESVWWQQTTDNSRK